jgi:predicted nucleotidyltransferase component of viral defense system
MPLAEAYRKQVALLIKMVPLVAAEHAFALKGGTAINLFLRDMPRVSVDIDLTYVPIKNRASSLKEIDAAMKRIAAAIEHGVRGAKVNASSLKGEKGITKLIVRADGAQIKIEVTPVMRGCVYEPEVRSVSALVEEEFGFAEMSVVSFPDLYGGKIVAALDRQHPRDLFDVRDLFAKEGIDDKVRKAFIVYLLSHDRPMAEVLLAFAILSSAQTQTAKPLSIAFEQVQRVEILYFPERVLVRAALSPERLEHLYQHKLEIRDVHESAESQRLPQLLRETSVKPSGHAYDHRTAVLLFDKDGRRIAFHVLRPVRHRCHHKRRIGDDKRRYLSLDEVLAEGCRRIVGVTVLREGATSAGVTTTRRLGRKSPLTTSKRTRGLPLQSSGNAGRSIGTNIDVDSLSSLDSDHSRGYGRRLVGLLGFRRSGFYFKTDPARKLA